jgi:hypothetical protein
MRRATLLVISLLSCASCGSSATTDAVRGLLEEAWAEGFNGRTHFISNGYNPRDVKRRELTMLWDVERTNFLKQHRQAGSDYAALVDFQVKAYQAGFLGESLQSVLDGLVARAVRAIE